jgi:hypothetical protein
MPRRLLLAFACALLARAADLMPAFRPGTILFQGDSITDGNRGRSLDPGEWEHTVRQFWPE